MPSSNCVKCCITSGSGNLLIVGCWKSLHILKAAAWVQNYNKCSKIFLYILSFYSIVKLPTNPILQGNVVVRGEHRSGKLLKLCLRYSYHSKVATLWRLSTNTALTSEWNVTSSSHWNTPKMFTLAALRVSCSSALWAVEKWKSAVVYKAEGEGVFYRTDGIYTHLGKM